MTLCVSSDPMQSPGPLFTNGLTVYTKASESRRGMITETEAYNALWAVLDHSTGHDSRIHGELHWSAVAAAGYHLCKMTPEADRRVVLLFAMFHDSMRESDGPDPEHGARAAELAYKLQESGDLELADEQLATLEEALVYHDKGQIHLDPSIGACWDADRLNLPRVGIKPDPDLMSTEAGKALALSRGAQRFPGLIFDWTSLFLNYQEHQGERQGGVYLRFGALPESGQSCVGITGLHEMGVSVFNGREGERHGERQAGDIYEIELSRLMAGPDTRALRIFLSQRRPLYLLDGEPAGMGGDGEPLLRNAAIVRELDDFGVSPSGPELAECVAWWRGGASLEGRFPYPYTTWLEGDPPVGKMTSYGLKQHYSGPEMRGFADLKHSVESALRLVRKKAPAPELFAASLKVSADLHKFQERRMTPEQRKVREINGAWLKTLNEAWKKQQEELKRQWRGA